MSTEGNIVRSVQARYFAGVEYPCVYLYSGNATYLGSVYGEEIILTRMRNLWALRTR